MSDLEVMFEFSDECAKPDKLSPFGGRFVSLRKICQPETAADMQLRIRVALGVCKLDPTGEGASLNPGPPGARRVAVATVVLASAAIHSTPEIDLILLYIKMQTSSIRACKDALRRLMTVDDVLPSPFARVSLRNFTWAGDNLQKWRSEVLGAYARSLILILRVGQQLSSGRDTANTPRVAAAFKKYFGDYLAPVRARLEWEPKNKQVPWSLPADQSRLTHGAVVVKVLRRLVTFYDEQSIVFELRIRSQGKRVACAAVDPDSEVITPTTIGINSHFFSTDFTESSRAADVIHELSHMWACTADHAYGRHDCANLALKSPGHALTNADSYTFFVSEAFDAADAFD